jgi:hypothetical protein
MNIHDGDDLQIQKHGSNWKCGLNAPCKTMPESQADGGEYFALCPGDSSTLPEESPGLVKGHL